jgi:hypothetical protein
MVDALEWFQSATDDEKAKVQAWFAEHTPDYLGKNLWGRSLNFKTILNIEENVLIRQNYKSNNKQIKT